MFVSQETVDRWLGDERIEIDGERMTLRPEGQQFLLRTAVHLTSEIADGGDEEQLVGRVKDLEALAEIGGEHFADSVILGDNAYEVVVGFIGEPIVNEAEDVATGHDLAAAARAAAGEGPPSVEIDLLARFFLTSR
ncbi:MAG: hypothetical protein OEY14_14340 [Myxococcales bacterium]|nr:hypothetical protein [Myxococcales bacterium]